MHIPDFSQYRLPNTSNVFASKNELETQLLISIGKWLKTPNPQMAFSVDGLPGSGKSRLMQLLKKIKIDYIDQFEMITLETDRFLATRRGTAERKQLAQTENSEEFWELFYRRDRIKEVLNHVQERGWSGGHMKLGETYSRLSGNFVSDERLEVPDGKKLVVLEGVDSTSVVEEVYSELNEREHILVYAPPHTSLRSALRRDIEDNGLKQEERSQQRTHEYRFIIEKLITTLQRPDVLILDNTENHRSA